MKGDVVSRLWPAHPSAEPYNFLPAAYFIDSLYSPVVVSNDVHISHAIHQSFGFHFEREPVYVNCWQEPDGSRNL